MASLFVVKVGTNVVSRADGSPDITTMSQLVDQISQLKKAGNQVILVSSGAVGSGRAALRHITETNPVIQRQLFAAVGQVRLMNRWAELFSQYQLFCGQVLATREDFRDRNHYLNMKNCFQALLRDEIIPIVNENDVISVSELMFTDNDELAGLIAGMMNASHLVLLTNVDGIFTGQPGEPGSEQIPEIRAGEKKLTIVTPTKSSFGRGGMQTKYRIALKTARMGIPVTIANGKQPGVLTDLVTGKSRGTRLVAETAASGVKKWLAFQAEAKPAIRINHGALSALRDRTQVRSLLPVGVTDIVNDFNRGDLIRILGPASEPVGVGKAQYGSDKLRDWMGQSGKKPVIHYDYLFLDDDHE